MSLKAAIVMLVVLVVTVSLSSGAGLVLNLDEPTQAIPGSVRLNVNGSRAINLVGGSSYVISCQSPSGGFQQSQVWFRNGSAVDVRAVGSGTMEAGVYAISENSNRWDLVLNVFGSSSTGQYTCRRMDDQVSLVIGMSNPVAIATVPTLSLNVGSQILFHALITFVSGSPHPTTEQITWTVNGAPSTVTGHVFQLPLNINRDHAGLYVCSVTTAQGTATAEFTVTVNVQPQVTLSPATVPPVEEDGSFTLTCADTEGAPPPTFEWSRDTQVISGDGSRVLVTTSVEDVSSTLSIMSVEPSDAGSYSCTGANGAGASTRRTDVIVWYAPILTAISARTTWVVGQTLLLEASLVGAVPRTIDSVAWTKDSANSRGTPSSEGSKYTLTVPGLTLGDEGTYELTLTNEIGAGTPLSFSITVNSPPTLSVNTDTLYVLNNAVNTTLIVTVTNAKPQVMSSQISWFYTSDGGGSSGLINTGLPRYSSVLNGDSLQLVIEGPTPADNGVYTVRVYHSAGNVSQDVTLRVLNPPAPLTNITATPINNSPCMVRVQWITDTPLNSATSDYTIIEISVDGGKWVEFVRSETDVDVVRVVPPGAGLNTIYQLRGHGESNLPGIGQGALFTSPVQYTAYQSDSVPNIINPSGSPDTPTSIRISWGFPQQDCYEFVSHQVSCYIDEQLASSSSLLPGGTTNHGVVDGLAVDTLYNCSVSSNVTVGGVAQSVRSTTVLTFTYPNAPPTPAPPLVNESSADTITVNFNLPTNHENISHYQVMIIRLSSRSSLPSQSPDILYPHGYPFTNHTNAHTIVDNQMPYIAAEIAGDLFSSVFVLGGGEVTMGTGGSYDNGKLTPGSLYSCFLRAFPKTFYDRPFKRRKRADDALSKRQYDIFSSSDFLPVQETESPPGNLLSVVIGVCVVMLIVLAVLVVLLVVGICCLRMRRQKRRFRLGHKAEVDLSRSSSIDGSPAFIPTPDLGRKTNGIELKQINMINPLSNGSMFEPSGPITEEDFATHVEKFDANRQLLFQEEFEWIQTNSPWHPADASNHPLNDEKNRYHNITAFDHTRVKLTPEDGVECSDYINANYVLGYSGGKEYIATQGPLEQTVVEFWNMVWEQNTATIVMLTNLVELGKVKCTQYWPMNGTVIYGGVKVTLESVVNLPNYTIRKLNVTSMLSNDSRMVLQFQFTRWPDYGVPKLAAPLLNFLRAVNTSNPPGAGPIITHCSAGVGRSGTVIAIDYCLKQLKKDQYMDPCGFIRKMRNQRNYMVQTEQQYTFLHFALLEAITYGDTSFDLSTFSDSYQGLQEMNPASGLTLLEEEFRRIGCVKTMTKRSSFQQKIKNKGAPQRHFNSSFMGSVSSTAPSLEPYIAHYMDTYSEPRRLVVVDGPTEDSVAKWWQMVWDEDVAFVVNMTPQDEEVLQYWPEEVGDMVTYGTIVVQVVETTAEHLYTCRKIKLANTKVEGISHTVEQFHFIGWTTQYVPRVPDFVRFVCVIMDGMDSLAKNQRVLLHDIDSLGPSGVMCSLYYCIQRLRTERMVDVFQAVQLIKLQRPGSVKSVREYAFIYDCIYEFIRTHTSSDSQ